jgi:predicted phage terminase large subunit-like protein
MPIPPLREWTGRYLSSYFPLAASSFHLFLFEQLQALHHRRGVRLNWLAPRGSAKSTLSTFAYPLFAALHGIEPYIMLTADTGDQAHKYLDAIRAELETNAGLECDYPHLFGAGPVWRQDRIQLGNGILIEALGTGKKIRGRKNRQHRPSLIIVDDPQNTDHIASAIMRERSWDWLTRDVCNAGSPTTNVLVLGTALHREGIVCRLQKTPGWESSIFKSVVSWPERMDLWREWEMLLFDYEDSARETNARAFYEGNRAAMEAGASVLWPEREDLYALMLLRATIGSAAFESEKQNNPVNPELCEWPDEYFDWPGFWFDKWPEVLQVKVLALDPSKGRDAKHGDYSAWVGYGRDANGIEYVEADLKRRNTEKILADGVEHARSFRPDAIAVETNTFQELLIAPMRQAFLAAGIDMPPIIPFENTAPKPVRIRRLGPPLHQRRMRFKARSPGTALLVQQLRDFSVGDHDDGPDALEMARRGAIELINGRQRQRGRR